TDYAEFHRLSDHVFLSICENLRNLWMSSVSRSRDRCAMFLSSILLSFPLLSSCDSCFPRVRDISVTCGFLSFAVRRFGSIETDALVMNMTLKTWNLSPLMRMLLRPFRAAVGGGFRYPGRRPGLGYFRPFRPHARF